MAKFICKVACYHEDRIFKEGDLFEGSSAPKHFNKMVPAVQYVEAPQEVEVSPTTLSEMQAEEDRKAFIIQVGKMVKDDLIATAVSKGYSEKYDLASVTNAELKALILEGTVPKKYADLSSALS